MLLDDEDSKKTSMEEQLKKIVDKIGLENINNFCVDGLNLDIDIENSSIRLVSFENKDSFSVFMNAIRNIYLKEQEKIKEKNKELDKNDVYFNKIFWKNWRNKYFWIGSIIAWIIILTILRLLIGPISIPTILLGYSFGSTSCNILTSLVGSKINREIYEQRFATFEKYNGIINQLDELLKIIEKQGVDPISEIQKLIQTTIESYHEVGETDIQHSKGQKTMEYGQGN